MKRAIIVEILLLTVFGILIAETVAQWQDAAQWLNAIHILKTDYNSQTVGYDQTLNYYHEMLTPFLIHGVLTLIAILCDIVAIVIVAIHNFVFFKPILDKLAAHKQLRADARKQERIEQLENELNELKKDE